MAGYYDTKSLQFVLALFLALLQLVNPSKISNLKMCGDPECKTTISEASAIKSYLKEDKRFLSFNENDIVIIKSKSAGRIPFLWSGEVNGQFGYFPMSHVRENQVFIRNPSHLVPTEEVSNEFHESKPNSESEPKELDETEIEEDEPSSVKEKETKDQVDSPLEEDKREDEKDETEIDEEEEEETLQRSEATLHSNTKEGSITQHLAGMMNVFESNLDSPNINKKDHDLSENKVREELEKPLVMNKENIQNSEIELTETTHETVGNVKHQIQPTHSSIVREAHQTHSQESTHPTHLIDATSAVNTFTSQSSHSMFDSTAIYHPETSQSQASLIASVSSFTYENPTEKSTEVITGSDAPQIPSALRTAYDYSTKKPSKAFMEPSVTNKASLATEKLWSENIEPSASTFVPPSSNNFNPNHDTFIKKTKYYQDLENIPNRERQPEGGSNSRHNSLLAGFNDKGVSQPALPHYSSVTTNKVENDTALKKGNLMKGLDIYLKIILDMCPTTLQNLLEQEPFGISPTILLLYTIIGIVFSFFFLFTCTCFSNSSSKPRMDPVVIIRNLEEKLFVMTKEKENLEDEIQSIKENVSTLQHNVAVQKSSVGSVENDLQRQKLQNEELREVNDSLTQQLISTESKCQELNSLHEEKVIKLKCLEEKYSNVSQENNKICEKQHVLTQELAAKESEISGLKSRTVKLMDQVQHLETRKEQLSKEAEEWTIKCRELTENWEQSQKDYVRMCETLDFKEKESEQMRECFVQLKAFQEDESDDISSCKDFLDSQSMEEKIQSMLDVSRVKATLSATEEERNSIQQSLQIEIESRLELEDQIESLKRDVETLQADKAKAIRQNDELQTKLNILTTYFKEKEMQFQRELGEHEILKKQNINRLGSAEEKAKSIEEELETYRSQNDDLKQEMDKAERDFRAQIASNEKKAHENWLATRAAERELKESRMECTMLRLKLTELERRPIPGSVIRPLPTRGSGHLEMVNGPALHPLFPPDHPSSRKDLLPPVRDDPSKPPIKSPSPNFRPPLRPSPQNFRPPLLMKKRGPPPPPPNMVDGRDPFPPWQMPPPPGPGPRLPFGNRPPPPPPSKVNPRGTPFGNPLPHSMNVSMPHRAPQDLSSLPEKHSSNKQHSQV